MIPNDAIITLLSSASPDATEIEVTVEDLYQAFKARLMHGIEESQQELFKQLTPKCDPVKPGPDANV